MPLHVGRLTFQRTFQMIPRMMMAPTLITNENCKDLFSSFDYILTDCDGVLWHGNNPTPGSIEALRTLRKMGKQLFFVTNNSTQTRQEYVSKFQKLGFEASVDEIYCTANAIAGYLQKIGFDKKAYVVGSNGLSKELDIAGIRHIGIGPDLVNGEIRDLVFGNITLDKEIGAVIVGLDRDFNYIKLLKAASYLRDPDCLFIASNLDTRFPVDHTQFVVPGTGAIVSSVVTASARQPIVVGKPNLGMFEAMAYQHGIDPAKTIMIGDRLDTDILFGSNCGLKTLLVLTGISSLEDVEKSAVGDSIENKKLIPDYYINSIGDLGDLLKC